MCRCLERLFIAACRRAAWYSLWIMSCEWSKLSFRTIWAPAVGFTRIVTRAHHESPLIQRCVCASILHTHAAVYKHVQFAVDILRIADIEFGFRANIYKVLGHYVQSGVTWYMQYCNDVEALTGSYATIRQTAKTARSSLYCRMRRSTPFLGLYSD